MALLEQLIVFLAPRKRGAVREGAGLARSSILPLLAFWFVAALGFSFAVRRSHPRTKVVTLDSR